MEPVGTIAMFLAIDESIALRELAERETRRLSSSAAAWIAQCASIERLHATAC
jgi:hypothetical protein